MTVTTKHWVTGYEVIDHGTSFSDYFPGCGTWGTQCDHVVTGCGYTSLEALDDALDQLAWSFDVDSEQLDSLQHEIISNGFDEYDIDDCFESLPEDLDEYPMVRVSIRFNLN